MFRGTWTLSLMDTHELLCSSKCSRFAPWCCCFLIDCVLRWFVFVLLLLEQGLLYSLYCLLIAMNTFCNRSTLLARAPRYIGLKKCPAVAGPEISRSRVYFLVFLSVKSIFVCQSRLCSGCAGLYQCLSVRPSAIFITKFTIIFH